MIVYETNIIGKVFKIENVTTFFAIAFEIFFFFNPWKINFKHRSYEPSTLLIFLNLHIFPFHRTWRISKSVLSVDTYAPSASTLSISVRRITIAIIMLYVYRAAFLFSYGDLSARFFEISKRYRSERNQRTEESFAYALCIIRIRIRCGGISWPEGSHAEILHEEQELSLLSAPFPASVCNAGRRIYSLFTAKYVLLFWRECVYI